VLDKVVDTSTYTPYRPEIEPDLKMKFKTNRLHNIHSLEDEPTQINQLCNFCVSNGVKMSNLVSQFPEPYPKLNLVLELKEDTKKDPTTKTNIGASSATTAKTTSETGQWGGFCDFIVFLFSETAMEIRIFLEKTSVYSHNDPGTPCPCIPLLFVYDLLFEQVANT
jgi:hypothetical protein